MGIAERKVFLIKPDRNKEPVAYVNIPAEVKRFYCFEKDGVWFADRVRVVFDEDTGVMVVIPKWIDRKAEVAGVVRETVRKAMEEQAGGQKEMEEKENGKKERGEQEKGEKMNGEKEMGEKEMREQAGGEKANGEQASSGEKMMGDRGADAEQSTAGVEGAKPIVRKPLVI